ncbi:4-hydroxythreonine-4-phosphate dehydrogenase [Pseudoclavibacter sp. JAI123]|uniref:4-hydroxythreonine-4-phosphate dehydrogenase PdxA n=1 Tax=Pseudoclavibacter sp. JAI123 TaxID=2723065 RepID=UPI0015C77FD8|nr:4-hydroxythreonine-4-phosphate dehydrogenase PdxA [Pseudoclavibacter sp. JAI123]NYF14802.1 4-hydroxythreonine-4-phosphate dehydrogenase [Pseudoclavibacter sp. JAI123]
MTIDTPLARKRIAITAGDPAGVGPELLARAIARRASGEGDNLIVFAAEDELRRGFEQADLRDSMDEFLAADGVEVRPLSDFPSTPVGEVHGDSGRWALTALRAALDAIESQDADALVFGPLNKASLHASGMQEYDEMRWFEGQMQAESEVSELNASAGLWTSRVTSHVPLRAVADLITEERIIAVTRLLSEQMSAAGFTNPKLAVCALNPHGGENGSFGTEEIDIIAPAVKAAAAQGLNVEGPFPADTLFVTAKRRGYQGIVTMFHDQGQLALKAMGFAGGVTVEAGLGIAIATPAHGTAFDIVGTGQADTASMFNALDIAGRLTDAS